MINGIYAIKDVKVGFQPPMTMTSDQVAMRAFNGGLKNKEQWPYTEDYELWKLGEYNDETGELFPQIPAYMMGGKDIAVQ